MDNKILEAINYFGTSTSMKDDSALGSTKFVSNKLVSYTDRHRGQWFRPEYSFGDIQRAQDAEALLGRAIEIKSTKFLLAGWEFVGQNPATVQYILKRIQQLEIATNKPFAMLMYQTAQDLFRYNNALWVLARDAANSGGKPYSYANLKLDPIAGAFIAPFETLEFKTKPNGAIDRVRQVVSGASKTPEFAAKDVIHFWMNRRPGFSVGSPVLFSVLEDISLLRSIEENVEELIQCNLFPLFHYKIGSDKYPERVNVKTGLRESEVIAQQLEYMPSSGVYISDWRHEIEAVGSEGRALRIDYYLEYFKKRVLAGLGISPVDIGEGDSSNRSTAQTQSKALTETVESLQKIMKSFIDFYFITPLLLEGSFAIDPLTPENIVEIKFGKIDTTEQTLLDNNTSQLWLNNAITHDELRKRIGERPLKEEQEARLYARLFPTPVPATAQVPGAPGSSMSENQHGIKPKIPAKTKDGILRDDLNERWDFLKSQIVPFTNGGSPGDITKKLISTWGEQSADRVYSLLKDRFTEGFNTTGKDRWDYNLDKETIVLKDFSKILIDNVCKTLIKKIEDLHPKGLSISTIFDSLKWRISLIEKDILSKSYNYGRCIAFLLEENTSIRIVSNEDSCETCKKHNNTVIHRNDFNFEIIPPGTKYGHPGCKCTVEKNEE